jgi:hypothetical protein
MMICRSNISTVAATLEEYPEAAEGFRHCQSQISQKHPLENHHLLCSCCYPSLAAVRDDGCKAQGAAAAAAHTAAVGVW